MQRVFALLLTMFLLAGCGSREDRSQTALILRQKLLNANGCSFHAVITVDYGDKYQSFGMACQFDSAGNLTFEVTQPETIAAITGKIASDGGKLTFDDKVLAFPLVADEEISPVAAPWVLMKSLRSGYMTSTSTAGTTMCVNIDDSYEGEACNVDVYFNDSYQLIGGEIIWHGRKILTIVVEDFAYL